MNLTNYHSHNTFCDGRASMEEFVRAAIGEGFTSFGFSSHAPLPYRTGWNMDAADLPNYIAEAQRLKKKYADRIELYTGLEIDYLNDDYNPSSPMFVSLPLDYRIGSVHTVYDAEGAVHEIDCSIEQFRTIVSENFGGDLRDIAEQYFARQMRMLELGGFDIVGHADKMFILAQQIEPNLGGEAWWNEMVERHLEAIAEKGYIVEMNTKAFERSGLFFPHAKCYEWLRQRGVRVVVNSDVHYLDRINSGRAAGLALLKGAGYKYVSELKAGIWTDVEIE